jgi:glycosyltransferase involved in cell wall biosynthesis
MVVANDVTRDSRVLREASALSAAGHRVTVLGIMTARTMAPEVEVRDGFVIRRLHYRARPPGWWVPPDFYARVRHRAARQYRLHRARVSGLARRIRRPARLIDRRLRRVGPASRFHRAAARWWGIVARPARRTRFAVVQHDGRMLYVAPWGFHAVDRRGRWRARSALVATAVRAVVSRVASRVAASSALARGMASRRRIVRRLARMVRESHQVGDAAILWRGSLARMAAVGRGVGVAWGRTGATARLVRRRISAPVARGLHAWGTIAAMVAWGSGYLLVNRATGGAVEWVTGWRWRWLGWARHVAEHAPDADVWHGHDMTSLPAIVSLKRDRGGLAIYDSHEVYLESGRHAAQPRWAKAVLEKLERELVAEVDAVITVNDSLARILGSRFGRRVEVLYNCPPRPTRALRGSPLRRALGLPRSTPLILYHGSLAPHRGIEQLLVAIRRQELSGVHLAFLGFGSLTDWLLREARDASYENRVHVLDAVAPADLVAWLAGVDVAVAPIQASTLNHRYSSPNKVFEAIAAGTPVAGSNFPEFRRVINDPRYGPLGELFDPARPDHIAAAVRRLLTLAPSERAVLRRRCRRAAAERWNWEAESRRLVDLYESLAGREATGHIALRVASGVA